MFVYYTCAEYNMLQAGLQGLAGNGVKRHWSASLWCVSVSFLSVLESCCLVNVVVLNLRTLALQTLDCRVLSGNNNHNNFILF